MRFIYAVPALVLLGCSDKDKTGLSAPVSGRKTGTERLIPISKAAVDENIDSPYDDSDIRLKKTPIKEHEDNHDSSSEEPVSNNGHSNGVRGSSPSSQSKEEPVSNNGHSNGVGRRSEYPRPEVDLSCDPKRIADATALIGTSNFGRFLTREYEPFLTKCLKDIGGERVTTLMENQARMVLSTLRAAADIPASNRIPDSREEIDKEIDQLWARVKADSRMLKQVVRLSNLGLLRYVAGVQEGSRIMLENGGLAALLHSKDREVRYSSFDINTDSLERRLEDPINQLLSERIALETSQDKPSASALYRPKYVEDLEFVWRNDPEMNANLRRSLLNEITGAIETYNAQASQRIYLGNRGTESMFDLFNLNDGQFGTLMNLMNLNDRDLLAVLFRQDRADDLLRRRAGIVLDRLRVYSKNNRDTNCPFADRLEGIDPSALRDPVDFCLSEIVPHMRSFTDIIRNHNQYLVAFLMGIMNGLAIAQLGPEYELELQVARWPHYTTLGLEKSATIEEIKRAYKKLASKYHPDRSKNPATIAKFQEIGEAYAVLTDMERKLEYDQVGETTRIKLWDLLFPTQERITEAFKFVTEKQLTDLREKEMSVFKLLD